VAYIKTSQDTKCILHSTLQLLCKAISCPNSATCTLRNSYRSSVMCQLLFHLNKNRTLINFSKLPNKNVYENLYGASVRICRHIQTSTVKLRDILLQLFIQVCQKNYWIFLGNVTRHYHQWWNNLSLCQTSFMNVPERKTHN